MERKDKKLYVYTTAFRQPIWVHKLNEEYSLPFAIKMSAIVYGLVILVLTWFLLGFFPFLWLQQVQSCLAFFLPWIGVGDLWVLFLLDGDLETCWLIIRLMVKIFFVLFMSI